jgi:hypothetical protein
MENKNKELLLLMRKIMMKVLTLFFAYILPVLHLIVCGRRKFNPTMPGYLKGKYSLEIIDVYQQAAIAEKEQIIALPLLVKTHPLPERRLIGDMSDTAKVLRGLGIVSRK